MTAGTIAYIASNNGDYVGGIYNKDKNMQYFPFKLGLYNLERIITNYEKDVENTNISNLQDTLKFIAKNLKKRMIIFVITDIEGMDKVEEETLKCLSAVNDVLFVNINDAYMSGEKVYDIEKSFYIPKLFLSNKKLHEIEKKAKEQIYLKCVNKLKKYRIQLETIDTTKEVAAKLINLLERHKYANIS